MIKLRVTHGFRDLEAGVHRKPGEVFEVSEARARVILAAGVAEVAQAIEGPPAPAKERPRRKKG